MLSEFSTCQIAYVVPDVRVAAARHAALFGSGPFFTVENIEFSWVKYRGQPTDWDHTIAIGQWGDIGIEFMQQNNAGPSVLLDVTPEGSTRGAVHHMAYMVPDPAGMAARFAEAGYPLALHGALGNGIEVFMVDTLDLYGHMIELYEPTPALLAIHGYVRDQSIGWDGTDPIRTLTF
ncbi:MAG: VOC family protein [Pseudomonadota bacterium]